MLNGARKLSTISEYKRRVYISPDEPLEVRRRNTLDQLKKKAMNDGKTMSVSSDGVLSVDDVIKFTLKGEFITSSAVSSDVNGLVRRRNDGSTSSNHDG